MWKPEYLEQLRRSLNSNDPKAAAYNFRQRIQSAGLKKGDRILVHDVLPAGLAKWVRAYCAERGVTCNLAGKGYQVHITTTEDDARAAKEREEQRRAHEDWINSPG